MGRYRAVKVLLQPTTSQRARLERLLDAQCELYNAALQERRGAWRWEARRVTRYDQFKGLTGLSWEGSVFGTCVARGTLLRLDRAFDAFFRRIRVGATPGFPRFKPRSQWTSIEYQDRPGWQAKVDERRLHVQGVGAIKSRFQLRGLPGTPRTMTLRQEGRRWFAIIFCADVPANPLPAANAAVGIDVGLRALVARSDGKLVDNPAHQTRAAARLAREQRRLSRCQRGSKRRRRQVERVAAAHRKIANQRRSTLHQLSHDLVRDFDLIVVEDLHIANMLRKPRPVVDPDGGWARNGAAAKASLNAGIADAGWGILHDMLVYKAESAGRRVVEVNPRYTSSTCHRCGEVDPGSRVGGRFGCRTCGHEDDADVNAAKNILRLGQSQRESAERRTPAPGGAGPPVASP
jgi:putative transposase